MGSFVGQDCFSLNQFWGEEQSFQSDGGIRKKTEHIYRSRHDVLYRPVAPVAHQVILEPGIGRFREFEPPRVHTRINSWGLFLVHKLTCGKRESVELATLDEKSTSSGIC